MFEYIEKLSINQSEELKKTIRDLFRQTCILQVKYDPVTLTPRDNPKYKICQEHRAFIEDYLAVLGCELIHDSVEGVFRIAGDGVVTKKLGLTATKIVLLVKMIYADKIMGEGLNATTTTRAEIRTYGRNTGLLMDKLTLGEWYDAFVVMRDHQMIEVPLAISNIEDDTPIYIYNTVNILCPTNEINALVEEFKDELSEPDFQNEVLEDGGDNAFEEDI